MPTVLNQVAIGQWYEYLKDMGKPYADAFVEEHMMPEATPEDMLFRQAAHDAVEITELKRENAELKSGPGLDAKWKQLADTDWQEMPEIDPLTKLDIQLGAHNEEARGWHDE